MARRPYWLVLGGVLAGGAHAQAPPPAPPLLTVARIFGTQDFSSHLVTLRWMKDGRSWTTVETDASGTSDLYRVEAATGQRERLVTGADLVPPAGSSPLTIEQYDLSADESKVLIFTNSVRLWRRNTKGTYYVWDLRRRRLIPVSTKPGYQMFAKFSPDGRSVGFVRDNNIFVTDLATGREQQVTRDGSKDIINGTTDWVYEEELDLRDAFRFSPDGRRIAFWRFDQTPVSTYFMLDQLGLYADVVPVRYPKAGTANSRVRLGVFDLASGKTVWINAGRDPEAYLPRMDFAGSPDSLWFLRLNRHQNRAELLLADARTGASRVIMTDRDSAWVEVHEPIWLDGGRQFLTVSERQGFAQLYLYARDGKLVRRVTAGPWDVLATYGVDEQNATVYFAAAADGPLMRPLYRIGLDGRGFRKVSTEPGTHTVSFDPTFQYYVDVHSRAAEPPVQTLHGADGGQIRVVADDRVLRDRVTALKLRAPEFLTVATSPGVQLNAYLIKPANFDSTRRYPLLMYVYGGPGSQTVTDSWGGTLYLWHQLLAQQGYLVASVDNRGTGGRGARFTKLTYLSLGTYESADQVAAARYLGSLSYVDAARIGIWGGSYGGYLTLLSMFKGAGIFKAAMARAPVTDWRLYDTIYTERYMRAPQENPDGYRKGSPQTYAERLEGNLLLVHGTGDDNVHVQNTIQLIQILEDADKQFDMRLYPNKTHAIAGAETQVNLYNLYLSWLKKNL